MISADFKKQFSTNFSLEVSFEIKSGEIIALFGESGAGKTSLLRVLSGFEKACGWAKKDDFVYFDEENFTKAQDRNIGFLFQDYALFPNMSVLGNLLYAKNDEKMADFLLETCELKEYKNAKISALSGGQKQRIALCRALMREPKVLLLDEPFCALDSKIKEKLKQYLLKIHSIFKPTIIIVSHDKNDILSLADKVFVMQNGKIIKSAKSDEIFSQNESEFYKSEFYENMENLVLKAKVLAINENELKLELCDNFAKNTKPLKINDEILISKRL